MIAVVRIRGNAKIRYDMEDTMQMLNLKTTNNCVVVPETATFKGMIQKTKDFITYGKINKETFEKMLLKWGRIIGDKKVTKEYLKEKKYDVDKLFTDLESGKIRLQDVGIKTPFRLHPPRKGFKSTKRPFTMKGDLGNRGDKINLLLEKMI